MSGISTVLQLLKVLDEWTEALDNGSEIGVVYMDFEKAFDKVPHKRLISKLKAYGFPEEWLVDFLRGRTQHVWIMGELSEGKIIVSGIPQGTLAPFCS